MTKFIFIIIINVLVISPAIADDIYRWTDPETGKTMSAPYLPPYPIKEKRLAGQLPNGNVIQVILDPNSPELKAIVKRQKEEEAEQRRVAEQRAKEQAIREVEQRRIAEEQAKEQAARESLEIEQKRLAQEKEQAELVAHKKAEQIEQKRLAQEREETERVAKEQIAEERLIQERKSETQEILNSKNDAWDSFFAGPFQGMKDNTEEDSASNSNQKMGMRVNEKLSSISHAWASLSSSPSQEEIDVEPVVQEKEETERSIQKRAKQERLAQEKEEAEELAQKSAEQKQLTQQKLADSPVIKGFYIGIPRNEAIKLAKKIENVESSIKRLEEFEKSTNKYHTGLTFSMAFAEDKLTAISLRSSLFNAEEIPSEDFVKKFMDTYKIEKMKGGECDQFSCYIYEDSSKGFAIEIWLTPSGKNVYSILLKAIGSTKNIKF